MRNKIPAVAVIGAGLAGSEAALVLASRGIAVTLFEMRPDRMTPVHKTGDPAELVCSNSLKSDELPSAPAILKNELTLLKSPLIAAARETKVPAGMALAVDRELFSRKISQALEHHSLITIVRKECSEPPEDFDYCLIAAGPLASEGLSEWVQKTFSFEALHFYDAIAPIVSTDSIDMDIAFWESRYGKGSADYCNCPFTEEEYNCFYEALIEADRVKKHSFEDKRFFEACLPIEVVAQRGYDALPFGCLKPVGFTDRRSGKRPYAVCQLRKETKASQSLNIVGFQTRMTFSEQKRVFRLIPGLERAEFLRYGSIHRNTYINAPSLLSQDLSFKQMPELFIAGQMCGNEGYTESIATGHFAALSIWARINNITLSLPPTTTAIGAILKNITHSDSKHFTPCNVNFGIIDPLPIIKGKRKMGKREKRELMAKKANEEMSAWIKQSLFVA